MPKRNDDFLKKLLSTFKIEAAEHIRKISTGLLELEKSPSVERQTQIIETIFREVHSLKGAARAVNITEIEAICQSLESVFAALKRKEKVLSAELFNLIYQGVDKIGSILSQDRVQEIEVGDRELPYEPRPQTTEPRIFATEPQSMPPILSDTVRISTTRLNSLLLKTEELLSAKLMANQHAADLRDITGELEKWGRELAKIRRQLSAVSSKQSPRSIFELLEENNAYVKSLETRLATLANSAEHDQRMIGRMVDDLLGDMKKVLMLPCSSLLEIFPKFVRDLSHDKGKDADLLFQGEEIEIDRRILEEMKDPLLHIVRNCIDHGIEKPEERERKKKPVRGTITISILPKDGDRVEIVVSDDGAGIDLLKVKASALKLGIISQKEIEKLSPQEALLLVFRSGVSTSPIITDISGRGLGLAIVQEKVEKLGGSISIATHPDIGIRFIITLPLTLATFRGVLVRVGEQTFIFPATNLERALKINSKEIKTVENRETISINGAAISLARLGDILELPRKDAQDRSADKAHLIVLNAASMRIAFLVDEIIGEQEVLVKGLGRQLSRVRNIAGASVLGTGKVVPILNVPDLMKSAVRIGAPAFKATAPPLGKKEEERRSILVVEDSITARMLLKNILEAAGYEVKTAVDGVDGFTQLRSGEFDIVISDVDMPRMNGFDLTVKIRADKKLSELPVVLVTALESREDREHGIDVGADAYIVKSSFDQSNLLEAIRRLI